MRFEPSKATFEGLKLRGRVQPKTVWITAARLICEGCHQEALSLVKGLPTKCNPSDASAIIGSVEFSDRNFGTNLIDILSASILSASHMSLSLG